MTAWRSATVRLDELRRRHGWTALCLALITLVVCGFYWPFFEEGLPPGDFGSTVALAVVQDELIRFPWDFPTWSPGLMCGRPTIGFMSPFEPLGLPFAGFEPILRMKALLVFFHVLSGFTAFALVRSSGAGRWAALFAGIVYPIMPSHVGRTAVQGHVQIPMFYALVPLVFMAFLRLRRWDARGTVLLALVLAACFVRDTQRTLLLLVVLAFPLAALLLAGCWSTLQSRGAWRRDLRVIAPVLLGVAFVLAVVLDSFELVNGFLGDPLKGGWISGEQAYWERKWSLSNLYTFFDRDGAVGSALEQRGLPFYASWSRYLGWIPCALALFGALDVEGMRRHRRRFWLVLSLLPISAWLSFGPSPVGSEVRRRWAALFASDAVPPTWKLAAAVVAATALGLLVTITCRHLSGRWRWPASVAIVAAGLGLFLFHAPLPWVREVAFFLRSFRNPDWFQVAASSFAVVFAAALAVDVIDRRLGSRRGRFAVLAGLLLLAMVDLHPYRRLLTLHQRSPEALAELRQSGLAIAADAEDCRAMPVESYSNYVDAVRIWHGKRLAWDFRSYTAPRYTQELINTLHGMIRDGSDRSVVATVAGLANVKYLIDERGFDLDLQTTPDLRPASVTERVVVFENAAYRPWVYSFRKAHALVGPSDDLAIILAARLAMQEVGLVHAEDGLGDRALASFEQVYAEYDRAPAGIVPPEAIDLSLGQITLPFRPRGPEAALTWKRPQPERIEVQASSRDRHLVVVAESFHPWWSARLDGEPVELHRASHAFLGVWMPPGDHALELRFRRPLSYWFWGWVSLLSLAASLAFVLLARRSGGAPGRTPPSRSRSARQKLT